MIRNFTSVTKQYDFQDGTTLTGYIIIENGKTSYVPLDPANKDYQAIQEWIAEGNTVMDNGGNS